MDHHKKKLLTQSVAFMQAHLSLTSDLLSTLKGNGTLTEEEVSTIQKDDTTTGKVLELLCMLKRKDNRTYTRFIQALDDKGHKDISDLLRSKGAMPEDMRGDPRNMHYLQSYLGKTAINQQTMNDMACHLVLKEVHVDEMNQLRDRIATLQHQLRFKGNGQVESTSSMSNSEGSGPSTPAPPATPTESSASAGSPTRSRSTDAGTPKWDVPSQYQELETILRQKDDILRRREEEYTKLRGILNTTQNDLQSVLDLNSQYLNIIGQMNQMQMHAAGTPRMHDKDAATLELERQLADAQHQVEEMETELETVGEELGLKEAELQKVLHREKRYKNMLGLGPEASVQDVEGKIKEILDEGSMRKTEVDKIKRELTKMVTNRENLEDRVTSLSREKEKIAFHMRQQELTMRKMKRMKVANPTIASAENMLAAHGFDRSQQLKLPFIERPGSQISLASTKSGRPTTQQYCVFCRSEYQPLKAPNCRVHFRPLRGGKWTCCKDDSHRSAGCLQVPHFYIEFSADKKTFLTDGARYMELT